MLDLGGGRLPRPSIARRWPRAAWSTCRTIEWLPFLNDAIAERFDPPSHAGRRARDVPLTAPSRAGERPRPGGDERIHHDIANMRPPGVHEQADLARAPARRRLRGGSNSAPSEHRPFRTKRCTGVDESVVRDEIAEGRVPLDVRGTSAHRTTRATGTPRRRGGEGASGDHDRFALRFVKPDSSK